MCNAALAIVEVEWSVALRCHFSSTPNGLISALELETQLRLQCMQAFLHGTKGYIYLDNQVQLSTLTYTLLNLGVRVQARLLHIPPSSTILQAVRLAIVPFLHCSW